MKALMKLFSIYLMLLAGMASGFSADMIVDHLVANENIGIGMSPTHELDVNGLARANQFYISGAHVGGSKEFLREHFNSTGELYGFEVRNWAGDYFESARTQLAIFVGDPSAPVAVTSIMDGSTSGTAGEFVSEATVFQMTISFCIPENEKLWLPLPRETLESGPPIPRLLLTWSAQSECRVRGTL